MMVALCNILNLTIYISWTSDYKLTYLLIYIYLAHIHQMYKLNTLLSKATLRFSLFSEVHDFSYKICQILELVSAEMLLLKGMQNWWFFGLGTSGANTSMDMKF